MTFSISQLFTPAGSGVNSGSTATPASGTWLSTLLSFAQTVGLNVTAWQPGGVTRTILSIVAAALAQSDAVVSTMAQGGFLDFAATGTVTTTSLNGQTVTQPVTPDPSIPSQNPTGAPGWLDLLADSVYNVQRIAGTYATGFLAIANTTTATYGPFVAGTYHAANPSTKATYSTTQSLTIPSSLLVGNAGVISAVSIGGNSAVATAGAHGLTTGNTVYISGVVGVTGINGGFFTITVTGTTTFQLNNPTPLTGGWSGGGTVYLATVASIAADVIGSGGTSAANTITQAVTSNVGVVVGNPAALVGSNYESNIALAARCRLKLQSLSPNGPRGAYQYFALTASQLLAAQTFPVTLAGGPITRATVTANPQTGVVTTTIANNPSTGLSLGAAVVAGVSGLGITGATNTTPIVITTASAHLLSSGNFVTISGVVGNTAANGTFTISGASGSTFTLVGSAGNGTYSANTGVVDGGDLGEVDTILQANVVPDAVTAITASATAFPITIVATVVVPAAQVAAYTSAVNLALSAYFASLPIGGVTPPGGSNGVLQYNDLIGVLFQAGSVAGGASYVQQITSMTLNGGTVNLNYPSSAAVAVLPTPTITVQGV